MQALQTFISFILSIDNTYDTAAISDISLAVQILDELLDTHPKTVAKQIDQLLQMQTYLLQHLDQPQLLDLAHLYDFIIGVVTKYPKLVTTRKIRYQKLLRSPIQIISHIQNTFTWQWTNPADGMTQDDLYAADTEMQIANQTMNSFQALTQLLAEKAQFTQFQKIFREYIQRNDDWRIQYAALMSASQLGTNLQVDQLSLYTEWAIKMLGHSQAKVRYSALHLLGQYSNDNKPQFQQKYFDVLTPKLIQMLHDSIPRVVSHDLVCITNLFEGYEETGKIQTYIGEIIPPILSYLATAPSWLKQSCLSLLTAISSVKDGLGSNLAQVFQSVKQLLSIYSSEPSHQQLLNKCFETMSFLLSCQNKDYIQQCIPIFAETLIINRDKINIHYFMTIWMRSCDQQLFVEVAKVQLVYQFILDRIQWIFRQEGDQNSLLAIRCLIKTAQIFKLRVEAFREPTFMLAKTVLNNEQLANEIRQEAVSLMTTFIQSIQSYQRQEYKIWLSTSTQTFQYLLSCLESIFANLQDSFQMMEWLLSGVRQLIIELHKAMSFEEITLFVSKLTAYQQQIEKCYAACQLNKTQIQNEQYDEQLGQEDTPSKIIETNIDCLVNGLETIPIIFSELLKTNNLQLKQWLLTKLISQIDYFIHSNTVDWKHYGLSIIITLIEACNSCELASYWNSLISTLQQSSSDPSPRIRNQAAYGMGQMFTKTPVESIRDQDVIRWMHQLWNALTTPYSRSQKLKKEIKHCQDNIISALGKLLKKFGPAFSHILDENIYRKWASFLPLNNDKIEGNYQQLFLIEVLDSTPTLLVRNAQDLKSVCQIYAKFISRRSERSQSEVIRLTRQSLLRIKGWNMFSSCSDFLWNSLSSSHISALTRLTNS